MPKCEKCKKSVKSSELFLAGERLVCKPCFGGKKMAETKTERKRVVSIHVYEIPTKDGARDHEVEVETSIGGLELKYATTFDKVREFFTEKRKEGEPAKLKCVK